MKILGYIDDGMNWFYNWQSSFGELNWIVIPLEIIFIMYFIIKYMPCGCGCSNP